eukprot:4793559-Amphidinium_carterae.1
MEHIPWHVLLQARTAETFPRKSLRQALNRYLFIFSIATPLNLKCTPIRRLCTSINNRHKGHGMHSAERPKGQHQSAQEPSSNSNTICTANQLVYGIIATP